MEIFASIMISIPLWIIAAELKRFNDFKKK